jgi:hypothetical protein
VKAERKEKKKNLHVLVCCVPAQGQRKKKSWAKYKKEKKKKREASKATRSFGRVLCCASVLVPRERESRVVVVV